MTRTKQRMKRIADIFVGCIFEKILKIKVDVTKSPISNKIENSKHISTYLSEREKEILKPKADSFQERHEFS